MKLTKTGLLIVALAIQSFAVGTLALTPMNVVEKSSYALQSLVNKNKIDASFATDVMTLAIEKTATGYTVEYRSPAAETNVYNTLNLNFDSAGKFTDSKVNFVGKNQQSPIFSKVSAATIFDLGAEAIVDHLKESADLVLVAQTIRVVQLSKENQGPHLRLELADGKIYSIQMDQDGKVLSKGF